MWHRKTYSEYLPDSRRVFSPFLPYIVFVCVAMLAGLGTVPATAQSQVRAVRLTDVEGSVQILHGDQTEFKQAFPNMPVLEGSRLETSNEGRAEIQFEDGSIARLTPNSSLNLDKLSRNADGATVNQLEVLSGLVYFEVGADRKQHYSILFGHNVITPNKASTFRVNLDTKPVELVVLSGSVQAANTDLYSVSVREGETVRFDPDDTRYYLAAGAEPDSWDQWNQDRDRALASISAQQTAMNRSGDMNGAGWSDLDYYGDWYSVPQYGNVWAPRGVGMGWDPYGSGYWGNYPGMGYMWISANPWGWLPYHCGGWNYFGGFGWGWLPNGCGGSQWLTDVVIWNAPSYYRRPQRPHPVGPGDHLPHHGAAIAGTVIAVNRGTSGVGGGGNMLVQGSGSPRLFPIGGRVLAPLPKIAQSTRAIEVAGPKSILRGTTTGSGSGSGIDTRLRPISPQNEGSQRGAYRPEASQRVSPGSSPEGAAPRTGAPVYSAPRTSAPPVYSAPRQSAPPVYSAPRQSAPPMYSAPRMEPHYSAPAPSPSHSSPPPASSPSPSPSGHSPK